MYKLGMLQVHVKGFGVATITAATLHTRLATTNEAWHRHHLHKLSFQTHSITT